MFPIYASVLSVAIWILRGRVWPVRCTYPETSRGRPCENWVAGEWHRCRYHNRRATYRFGHQVDPRIKRWQRVDRQGNFVDLPAIGVGVVRLRPSGKALLYQYGYARKPTDVLRIIPEFFRKTWRRLQSMRLRGTPPISPDEVGNAIAARNATAEGLAVVVAATRFALAAFGLALVGTLASILLEDAARTFLQWAATFGFVTAWSALNAGVYHQHDDWFTDACWKSVKWWLVILVPVGLLNLFFSAVN